MSHTVRQVLVLAVKKDPSVGDDARRCEALLCDLCRNGHKRERTALTLAVREHVVAELRAGNRGAPMAALLSRLAGRLHECGLQEDLAFWAVESWAVALGVSWADGVSTASLAPHQVARGPRDSLTCWEGAVEQALEGACSDKVPETEKNETKSRKWSVRRAIFVPMGIASALYLARLAVVRGIPKVEPGSARAAGESLAVEIALFNEQACNSGSAASCYSAGTEYENAQGVPLDLSVAARRYERACTGGVGAGCVALAQLYEYGRGVTLDSSRAQQLYAQACQAGWLVACQHELARSAQQSAPALSLSEPDLTVAAIADSAMEAAYYERRATEPPEARSGLLAAQRSWLADRASSCGVALEVPASDIAAEYSGDESTCFVRMTLERILELAPSRDLARRVRAALDQVSP